MTEPLFRYPAKWVSVVDGDTVKAQIDRGFGDLRTVSVRLMGVDAPESRTRKNMLERYAGKLVALVVEVWIREATGAQIMVSSEEKPKYHGRIVGQVWTDVDSYDQNLSSYLICEGLCRTYGGGKRLPWKDRELKAIVNKALKILEGETYQVEEIQNDCGF